MNKLDEYLEVVRNVTKITPLELYNENEFQEITDPEIFSKIIVEEHLKGSRTWTTETIYEKSKEDLPNDGVVMVFSSGRILVMGDEWIYDGTDESVEQANKDRVAAEVLEKEWKGYTNMQRAYTCILK